jgi:hypothetical protein
MIAGRFMLNFSAARHSTAQRPLKSITMNRAAFLMRQLFSYLDTIVKVGEKPLFIKKQAVLWAEQHNFTLKAHNINFCRGGFLHPPPHDNLPLRPGEAFTLDIWFKFQGFYADMAMPCLLPPYSEEMLHLKKTAIACNRAAKKEAVYGNPLFAIAQAVEKTAQKYNCFIIEEAFGHGIGRKLHQEPDIAFTYNAHNLFSKLKEGVITLEPVLSTQQQQLVLHNDGTAALTQKAPALFMETMHLITKGKSIELGLKPFSEI